MSDEELHIKIVVDDSAIKDTTGDLKKGFTQGGDAAGKMSEQTKMLMGQLSKLTGVNLAGMLGNKFGSITDKVKKFASALKEVGKAKSGVKDATKALNAAQTARDSLKKAKEAAQTKVNDAQTVLSGFGDSNTLLELQKAKRKAGSKLAKWNKRTPEEKEARTQKNQEKYPGWNGDQYHQGVYDKAAEAYEKYKKELDAAMARRKEAVKNRDSTQQSLDAAQQALGVAEKDTKIKEAQAVLAKGQAAAAKQALGSLVSAVGISIALSAITTAIAIAIKNIKKTIQEINELWRKSIQTGASTQTIQQIEYLQNYLGVTEEQLATITSENTEAVKKLLQRQADLGGVATAEQVQRIKELNQATTDFKEAWSSLWTNVAAALAPVIQAFADLMTIIVAVTNGNAGKQVITDEDAANAIEMAQATGLIKKNLAGFDEVNILGQNTNQNTSEATDNSDKPFVTKAIGFFTKIKELIDTWNLDDVFSNMFGGFFKIFKKIKESFEFINTWKAEGFKAAMKGVWEDIASPWIWIGEKFQEVCDWFKGTKIAAALKIGLKAVKEALSIFWEATKVAFKITIQLIPKAFSGIWDAIKVGWNEVCEFFKGIFKSVGNFIIGVINKVIDGMNKISITVADWVPLIGGKTWGINIANIPTLAKGGVAYGPTTALIGEYAGASSNPEIVAPQSILKETIDASNGEMASVYAQVGRQIIQAINQKDLSVSIGDKDVAEATNRYNNQYRRITGKALLTI